MPAPLPREINPALDNMFQRVNGIYQNYVWVARFTDEIVNDVELDLKKAGQLAHINGPAFIALTTVPAGPDRAALRDAFLRRLEQEGLAWANIGTEFNPFVTQLQTLIDWIVANVPEAAAGQPMSELIVSNGNLTDQPRTIPKPAGLQTEAQALRNLFG